jgi:DNA-binding MarR family transcriptional regulator
VTGHQSTDPVEAFVEDWRAAGWGEELPMAATASIMRAQRTLLNRNEATLRSFDLTFPRYEVLVLLLFRPGNAVPLSRLSDWLMVHPTSVTNTVDRLEAKGLVRRTQHPRDRRALMVELTDDGRDTARRVVKALVDESFGVRGLTDDELRTLVSLLRKVRAGAGEFETSEP